MTATQIEAELVPLGEGARLLKMNRDKVVRRIQDGTLRGQQIFGRWFVHRSALPIEVGDSTAA